MFIGSWDSGLYALEAASGKMKWKLQTGTDPQIGNQQGFQSSPAVVNGIVYSGCRDAKLYAVDARTGEKKWEYFNNGSWVITSPAVLEGRVYLGLPTRACLSRLDAATGAKISSVDAHFPVFASPAIAGGAVYVATFEGKLRAYDLKSNEVLWTFATESSKQNAAALTNKEGRLDFEKVFQSNFIDEMATGLERMFTMGSIVSSPVIDGNALYFGSTDGYLYALN